MNFARSLAALMLIVVVGLVGYQIGITQNVAAVAPAVAAPAYYGYPYHWGFGFFGLLFPLLFLFFIFGLARAAFWGGHGRPGHWGRYGRFEEMHRELHGEKPGADTGQRT